MTQVINVHLQFPVPKNYEKGADGSFTNSTLSKIQQSFDFLAKIFAKSGVV